MLVRSRVVLYLPPKVENARVFTRRMSDHKIDRGMQILVAPMPWEIEVHWRICQPPVSRLLLSILASSDSLESFETRSHDQPLEVRSSVEKISQVYENLTILICDRVKWVRLLLSIRSICGINEPTVARSDQGDVSNAFLLSITLAIEWSRA